jgi:glucosamine--fructose-6-phosphate aminotransferase (isomerizing)
MCGIYGIIDNKNKIEAGKKVLMLRTLGIMNEERGTDAAGFGFVSSTGERKIIKSDGTSSEMDYAPLAGASVVLGHTRFGTISAKTALQAHPFNYKGVIMTHNGVVWSGHGKHPWAHGSSGVDSETLLRYIVAKGGFTKPVLENAIAEFGGTINIAALLPDNTVAMVRHGNPLAMAKIEDDVFVYSSEMIHLDDMLNYFGYGRDGKMVTEDDFLLISPDQTLVTQKLDVPRSTTSSYNHKGATSYGNYRDPSAASRRGHNASISEAELFSRYVD